MARLPRFNLADVPQHVIQRGNNRQACFFEEQDYIVYLEKLAEYAKQYKVAIHAYVLMTNHVHLLMTPKTPTGISQLMQSLGRYYVRYVNIKYKRTGTLWEGRYKATIVQSEKYFLTLMRYIELNPVRAEMAEMASEYPWCSFQSNALGKNIKLLTPHPIYKQLAPRKKERLEAYLALFDQQLAEYSLTEIRDATNKSWVLGDHRFKAQIAEQTGRASGPSSRGGDRKSDSFKKGKNGH